MTRNTFLVRCSAAVAAATLATGLAAILLAPPFPMRPANGHVVDHMAVVDAVEPGPKRLT